MDEIADNHLKALNLQLNQFRDDDSFCDVEINVEGSVFKCHRNILAASSEYFRCMFGGKFAESTASEVTLEDVDPQTFQDVVRFIYSGQVSISKTNLYKLVRASEFFQLSYLEELCFQYLQQNIDALAENGLEIYSYTRATGKTAVRQMIGKYIYKNFDYFSKTPEFLEMPFEDFIALMNTPITSPSASSTEDVFMNAIMRWIRHPSRSPRETKSHFNKLIQKIDFSKLSSDCVKYLIEMDFEDFTKLRKSITNDVTWSSHYNECSGKDETLVNKFPRLHVYVNAYSEDTNKSQFVTSIFTLYNQFDQQKWVLSYQYDCDNSYDFVRTTVLDGHLYCLSFSSSTRPAEKRQTFKMSSSISLFPDSYLKPPPLILENYNMCGFSKHIYVYNRNITSASTSVDQKQLFQSIYLYEREIDSWSSLPQPKQMFANACLTCDEQMVYLVGGTGSNKCVQGYDYRTSAWLSVAPTHNLFEEAACFAHQNKVYVSGGRWNPNSTEMYDRVAGKWQNLSQMNRGRSNHCMESFLHSKDYLVTSGEALSSTLDMEFYYIAENKWKDIAVPLYKAVKDSDLKFKNNLKVIDMIIYKPYGL